MKTFPSHSLTPGMYSSVEIFNLGVCVCRIKEWVDKLQQELVGLADTASAGENLKQVRGHTHCVSSLLSLWGL